VEQASTLFEFVEAQVEEASALAVDQRHAQLGLAPNNSAKGFRWKRRFTNNCVPGSCGGMIELAPDFLGA